MLNFNIGACGGVVACSTCHVVVKPEFFKKLPKADDEELDMLDLAFGLTEWFVRRGVLSRMIMCLIIRRAMFPFPTSFRLSTCGNVFRILSSFDGQWGLMVHCLSGQGSAARSRCVPRSTTSWSRSQKRHGMREDRTFVCVHRKFPIYPVCRAQSKC